MNRPGATPEEWDAFCALGLEKDLLPVVSDLTATVSPNSALGGIGKTPSRFNRDGHVVGIAEWTQKESSPDEITRWRADPRLGFCVKTGNVYGLDIDEDAPEVAARVEKVLTDGLGALPCRVRANSGKRLLAVRVDGELTKRIIKTSSGRIELLGKGQQFIAAGTHPSGVRYEWRGGLPENIPTVTADELLAAWGEAERLLAVPKVRALPLEHIGDQDLCRPRNAISLPSEVLSEGHVVEYLRALRAAIAHLPFEVADSYDTWFKVGLCLKNLDLRCPASRRADVEALWHEFSEKSPKYEVSEAQEKWADLPSPREVSFLSILKLARFHGWPGPGGSSAVDLTDARNVEVLAELADGRLRYVPQWRYWLYWDGTRWIRDEQRIFVQRIALSVSDVYAAKLDVIFASRPDLDEGSKRTAGELNKWIRHSQSRRGLEDMLKLAIANDSFVISASLLDVNKELLGVGNGVVDLRTGNLRSAAKDDYVTLYIEVNYDPKARAPRWESFVDEVSGRWDPGSRSIQLRPQLADYLQKALGYMLTGVTSEHKMFVAIGEGANGKSVLFDTIEQIFKGYVRVIPPESLMATPLLTDPERASPVLASLQGARLAISSESKVGQRLDVALIKRHTGGGSITARSMRSNAVTFEITHKLTLMTNAQPKLDHLDAAIQGRLHIIPFDVRWNRPGSAARDPNLPDGDKNLTEELKAEREGILAWCVAGAMSYFANGLEPPPEVLATTRRFLEEEDVLGRWVGSCRIVNNPREGARASDLYLSFKSWSTEQGGADAHMSQKAFSQELVRRGVLSMKDSTGTRYALTPPSDFEVEDLL